MNKKIIMLITFFCFGLANAPPIICRVFASVARMMPQRDLSIIVYLDDCLLISDTYEGRLKSQSCLISLLTRLSFTVKWEKAVEAPCRVSFLVLM